MIWFGKVFLLVLASGFKRTGHHMGMEWSEALRLCLKTLPYTDLAKSSYKLRLETF